MTRLLTFIVHNWPLKLAAIMLASLLYGILVIAQDTRQQPVRIPIEPRDQPASVALLSPLGDVSRVRYFAPEDVPVTDSSFVAWVDLGARGIGTGTRTVNVHVDPIDPRVEVFDWEPRRISVTLDPIVTRNVPIRVVRNQLPAGLDVRDPELPQDEAEVLGASTVLDRVARVEARVQVEPSGVSFDREVELVPVDAEGNEVAEVDVEPSAVRVQIDVLRVGETRTVPVLPDVVDEPAPGFRVGPVAVEPLVVTVGGDLEALETVQSVRTQPISLVGVTETLRRTVPLALPDGLVALSGGDVRVTVEIRPRDETRTFGAGVVLPDARNDLAYALSTERVLITIRGSVTDLERLEGRAITAQASVAGLGPGRHEVPVRVNLPAGLTLEAASPPTVVVTIAAPATPVPASAGAPPASP